MAVKASTPTVGTTAVRLSAQQVASVARPSSIAVTNPGPNPVYLGGKNVTAANGFPLQASSTAAVDLIGNDELWAVSTASQVVNVLETGVKV